MENLRGRPDGKSVVEIYSSKYVDVIYQEIGIKIYPFCIIAIIWCQMMQLWIDNQTQNNPVTTRSRKHSWE